MNYDSFWVYISLISTFLLNIIFSMALSSFSSLTKAKVDEKYKKDKKNPKILSLKALMEKRNKLMPSIQLWNTLLNLLLGAFIVIWYVNNAKDYSHIQTISLLLVSIFIFALIKVFIIKVSSLASYNICMAFSKTFEMISTVTFPAINLFFIILTPLFALFGKDIQKEAPFYSEQEIKFLVKESHRHGIIEKDEQELIHSIFEFGDTIVKEVMTPRPDMICVESGINLKDFITLVKQYEFSKIPVYEESIDNIIGIISVKDLFISADLHKIDTPIKSFVKPAVFVPANKKINALLKEMQKDKITMVIVVDEYGGTEGLVTLEDILEEIVGEISDEYDDIVHDFQLCDDGSYIVNANIVIEDVNNKLKLNIPTDKSETIAGFAYGSFDKVPSEGDVINLKDFSLKIEKITGKRIKKVRIQKTGGF